MPNSGSRRSRVLLITHDALGARLAGSAARCLALAGALHEAGHLPTVIGPSVLADLPARPFAVRPFERSRPRADVERFLRDADVVVLPFHGLFEMPFLFRSAQPLVFDLSDPIPLELLESRAIENPARAARMARDTVKILNQLLSRGDFFLCASERQRDLWLGALLARARLLHRDARDPALRRLIDVVPFGMPAAPPSPSRAGPRLKGAHPAIPSDAFVVVWGGALWDWLDASVAVRAMGAIAATRSDVHLVFLGTAHPGAPPGSQRIAEAERLARDLTLLDRSVHFLRGWIPYEERGEWLLECDAGLTTHTAHLESRFAFRTRVLDYLWAGLPVICTKGDVLADLVLQDGLGIVVDEEDPAAVASAIRRLAGDAAFAAACRERVAAIRPRFTWRVAAAPLVRFCDEPYLTSVGAANQARMSDLSALLRSGAEVLATRGPREAARRVRRMILLGRNRRRP